MKRFGHWTITAKCLVDESGSASAELAGMWLAGKPTG